MKISVIIPTYNSEKFIERAVESVLNQTFQDFEIIIVDDFSKDNTVKIIQELQKKDSRIKLLVLEKNSGGPALPKNKGFEISKGEFIAYLDDDDKWIDKDKLKRQVEFLDKNPEYALVGTGGIIVEEDSNKIMDYLVPETDDLIRKSILLKNPFIQSSVVVRKDILNKAGLYLVKEYINAEDYDLWLRVGLLGKLFNLIEPMTMYMVREGNTSSNSKKYILKNNIHLIYKYKGKYPNYKKSIGFAYFKFFIYKTISLIKNKKLKNKISNFFFKKYRKINLIN